MPDNDIRDQLARVTARTLEKMYVEWGITPGLPTPAVAVNRMADQIAEEGWRPPARVITTFEELDALPLGTVLVDQWRTAWFATSSTWRGLARSRADAPDRIVLPGTVQWTPDEAKGA